MAAGHRESVSDPLPNPLFSNKYKKKKLGKIPLPMAPTSVKVCERQ